MNSVFYLNQTLRYTSVFSILIGQGNNLFHETYSQTFHFSSLNFLSSFLKLHLRGF